MKKMTEPLKITCKLLDGRINSVDGLLYFDSIIYHAWFAKNYPETLLGTKKRVRDFPLTLPLSREDGGIRRYLASLGFFHQHSQAIEYWNKRSDFTGAANAKYLDAKGKVQVAAGPLKAYHMPQVIRTVSDIEFYCVGNRTKIEELLTYIPAIGKKPAAGWGRVREWVVEPFPEDWSTVGGYGLMRPMPVEEYTPQESARYQVRSCSIFPPGWNAKNHTLCYVPEVFR